MDGSVVSPVPASKLEGRGAVLGDPGDTALSYSNKMVGTPGTRPTLGDALPTSDFNGYFPTNPTAIV